MRSSRAAANKIGRTFEMKVDNKIVVFVILMGLAMIMALGFVTGCSQQTNDPVAVSATSAPAAVVAIDTQYLSYHGELVIFNGEEFIHERDVVDYVEGDPAGLSPYVDTVAIYTLQQQGSAEIETKAVRANGDIVTLQRPLRLLPREKNGLTFWSQKRGSSDKAILTLRQDKYHLEIVLSGQPVFAADGVLDAWAAYDMLYWLVDHTVYRLNWWDEKHEVEVYCAGAFGVSHHSDEAEGALVPFSMANARYYGRGDIFSPFPTD